LEGGYNLSTLGETVRAHVEELLRPLFSGAELQGIRPPPLEISR